MRVVVVEVDQPGQGLEIASLRHSLSYITCIVMNEPHVTHEVYTACELMTSRNVPDHEFAIWHKRRKD